MMKKFLNSWKFILSIVILLVLVLSFVIYNYFFKSKVVDLDKIDYKSLDDSNLQNLMMENIYSGLEANLSSDDYVVKSIAMTYISKEYIEELNYNNKSNIYFGFTLSELANMFQDKKYVFTVNDKNETIVKEFEFSNDNYKRMLSNVCIGTGIILGCATISILSTGTAISAIFMMSAKTATTMALSSAVIDGVLSYGVEYIKTGNTDKALNEGLVNSTEGFKMGAILGAVSGGSVEIASQLNQSKKFKNPNPVKRGQEGEKIAYNKYGGRQQEAYLNGNIVSSNTNGSVRPDLIRDVKGHLEAIETKDYNLDSSTSRKNLIKILREQVAERIKHLPKGSTQRICLVTKGRNYNKKFVNDFIKQIQNELRDVYPNIPIEAIY